jgi:hypothetical protein
MLNNIYSYIIQFRNFYKTQTKQVIVVEKDKQIIKNNWYIWPIQILVFLNLTNIIEFFNFNYLYNIDNIYFYNDIKSQSTMKLYSSVIIEFLYDKIDITDIIKKYHIDVPIYIIFDLENLEENDIVITIKVLNLGKIKINTYNDFNDIKFKKLSELI